MGNILSDPNFPGPDNRSCKKLKEQRCGSLSPMPYDNPFRASPQVIYYFLGDDDPQTIDWIPGQFAYRSYSTIRSPHLPQPLFIDHFILIAYGSIRTNGEDVLHCLGTMNPTGGLYGQPTYFDGVPEPEEGKDPHGCKQRDYGAFDPSYLWQNEPGYGGLSSSHTLLQVAELPNVIFRFSPASAKSIDIAGGNPDGRPDGVIAVIFGAPQTKTTF